MAEKTQEVDAQRFTTRLGQLSMCNLSSFPRRNVDLQILLKSAVLCIEQHATLQETEVNSALLRWRSALGLQIDYVSWRRRLVDLGYLRRDRARTAYSVARPSEETTGVRFAPDVEDVRVLDIVDRVHREAAAKREEYRRRTQ